MPDAYIAEIGEQSRAGFAPSKPVQGGVGQDAMEQHGQFGCWFICVVFGQLHHAVLHDVQSSLFISHVIERTLERAFFDACQKIREFFVGGQGGEER